MDFKDMVVPGITLVFAAGISFASLESAAQDVDELSTRVGALENKKAVSVGKQEVVDVKIEGVEKRLDKMEELMGKKAKALNFFIIGSGYNSLQHIKTIVQIQGLSS